MSPKLAARLTRLWARIYTIGLPGESRERRRSELESDLWESLASAEDARQIASRLARGIVDDVLWTGSQLDRHARGALWWTAGSFITLAVVTLCLIYPPDGEAMRTSMWRWPLTLIAHNLGFIALIGVRTSVDLRLTTRILGDRSVSELVRRLLPPTIAAAALVIASGLALASPAPASLLANTMIQVKLVLLTAALLNIWLLHAVALRSVEQWDNAVVCPVAARVSATLSMTLWGAIITASLMAPFWPGWS